MKFLICIVRRTFRAAGGHIGLWDPLSGLIREAGVTPRQTSWLRVRKVIFPLFSSLLILVMISFEVKAGESGEEVVDEATAAEMARRVMRRCWTRRYFRVRRSVRCVISRYMISGVRRTMRMRRYRRCFISLSRRSAI